MDTNATSSLFSASHQSQIRSNISGIFKSNLRDIFSSSDMRKDFYSNFPKQIEPDALYTLSVPSHLEKTYNRGEVHWVISRKNKQPTGQLADRHGKFRGTGIMEKAAQNADPTTDAIAAGVDILNKQNEIMIGQLNQIKLQNEIMIGQLNQIKLQNAAIMQQLMQITEIVSDIRSRVIALQKLHDTDLTGGIIGVRDLLLQIKDANDLSFQKAVLASAVNDLNRDRGRIQQELIGLLEDMPAIPRTEIGRVWKIARDNEFCTKVTEKHHRIQWLFSLYLTATMLLGYAYAVAGEDRAYGRVFMPDAELMNNVNLSKLIHAEKMFDTMPEDAWYKNTDEYLGRLGREAQKLFADEGVYQLQLTGSELEEVLSLETTEC